jgi:hypothetical protein
MQGVSSTTFPRIESRIDTKSPTYQEKLLKWENITLQFNLASAEASSESKSAIAIEKHTARQLLGKKERPGLLGVQDTNYL